MLHNIRILFFISVFTTGISAQCIAQKSSSLPSVEVIDEDGRKINFSNLRNKGNPILIHFWATWCTHCHIQLDDISEVYDDWKQETGVKVVAVSIDDSRSTSKVIPFAAGKGWEFELYMDPNGDLRRAMGVNMMPHTFIVNGIGEVIWQSTSYLHGDELEIYKVIKKL